MIRSTVTSSSTSSRNRQRLGGRAGGVRTLLQPALAQCLRLSERFFHYYFKSNHKKYLAWTLRPTVFVFENFRRKCANLVAPLTNGTAKRLVLCEAHPVRGHRKLRCNRNSIGDAILLRYCSESHMFFIFFFLRFGTSLSTLPTIIISGASG